MVVCVAILAAIVATLRSFQLNVLLLLLFASQNYSYARKHLLCVWGGGGNKISFYDFQVISVKLYKMGRLFLKRSVQHCIGYYYFILHHVVNQFIMKWQFIFIIHILATISKYIFFLGPKTFNSHLSFIYNHVLYRW